jgi:hypothetical protein
LGARDFIFQERASQAAFLARTAPAAAIQSAAAYRLKKGDRSWNLEPTIRHGCQAYFGPPRNIAWHRYADHGLSSQVCCLNFLAPLATEPHLLSQVVGNALGIERPKMMPVEPGPDGADWFVGFEWTGKANYLDEWAQGASAAIRGANATSADAVVRFEYAGQIETLLIEWKYTETYGAPIPKRGNETRRRRYTDKAFCAKRSDSVRSRSLGRGLLLGAVLPAIPPTDAGLAHGGGT